MLTKGSNLRENYMFFQGSDSFADLRLDFPLNFLSGRKAWSSNFDPSKFDLEMQTKASKLKFYEDVY
jgi:hypothetical protein